MKSHSQKQTDKWAKEHPVYNFLLMFFVFFVTFGAMPIIFAKIYRYFGIFNHMFFAWLAGFITVILFLSFAAYALGLDDGKK